MPSNASTRPRSPLHIKQDDKFYSRLLSKESSSANHSFRVYYGEKPGSVPFVWESQPGTPKAAVAAAAALPPLTPPPSSQFNSMRSKATKRDKNKKSSSRLGLITNLILRLTPRKTRLPSSPVSSSSVSSSSSSSNFSQLGSSISHQRSRFSSSRSSFSSRGDVYEDHGSQPPRSILCFRVRRNPRLLFHHSHKGKLVVSC